MLWTKPDNRAANQTAHATRVLVTGEDFKYPQGVDDSTIAFGYRFHELVGILRRRRRSITAIAILGTILVAAVGLLIPPKYTAKAQLLIEPQHTDSVGGQAPDARTADDLAIESTMDTHVAMLTSHDFLQRTLGSVLGVTSS